MKTIYYKIYLTLIFTVISLYKVGGCGPYYDPDGAYYNLFIQSIINDKQYEPFLVTDDLFFITAKDDIKNENIEEWEDYLGISYEEAYYLVFKADEEDIRNLLKGQKINDKKLDFINASFVKKYKEAFIYLAHAKYLEPYMHIISDDGWYYSAPQHAGDLNYEQEISTLKTFWSKTKDKELKLRYGYQLVRLAHYSMRYDDAIRFFDEYVEPLNFRPAMYYHALSQKSGAERGKGDISLANYHFLQVFTNSKNLKESAIISMKITEQNDWNELVEHAQNVKELNDAYLLLGWNLFNNPLSEIKKIIKNDPDAIQAKVLMVRAINQIERKDLALHIYPSWYWRDREGIDKNTNPDKRYPQVVSLTNDIINVSDGMIENPQVKDKNFWLMTSAYLHFLMKDFGKARDYLNEVDPVDALYMLQKRNLSFYIDICEPDIITPEVEATFYKDYYSFFTIGLAEKKKRDMWNESYDNEMRYFIKDVLANRYYLQKEYAKSFLLTNNITELENNPRLDLLDFLEEFYKKPDKTPLEECIAVNFNAKDNIENYFSYLRGVINLTNGNLLEAYTAFRKTNLKNYRVYIPDYVFGINAMECMECEPGEVLNRDYISDFTFIKDSMNFEELTATLLKLEEIGQKHNSLAPKANYLLGNFFYNTSNIGYFRYILRFDHNNYYSYKFLFYKKPDIYNDIYFKYYQTYYENPYPQSQKYLQLAYEKATNRELKAHIVFALSKCELGQSYDRDPDNYKYFYSSGEELLISERDYFGELMKYSNTKYFKEVETKCKYFEYYVNNVF